LVPAFARVHAAIPQARLQLVGDGPLRGILEHQVGSLGLAGRVELLGEREDVAAFLDEAACVVLPSRIEGFSYVLLEAMARGVPCIATAVGGTPDLIESGRSGLLVRPEDPQALADAITTVLADPVQAGRLGEAARRRVATEFSRERMITQTVEAYRAVVSGRLA